MGAEAARMVEGRAGGRRTDRGSIINPVARTGRVRAVLFDLDGTLYRQPPLRLMMAVELLAHTVASPWGALRRWRVLGEYRRAQERLRGSGRLEALAAAQVQAAAARAGVPSEYVQELVDEWMLARPLRHMKRWRAPGLMELLATLEARGVRAGVLSDYPAAAKLEALGLTGCFSPVLCASDPEIAALKPDPRGFHRASEIWQVPPADVLVVGDRVDVDAAGAAAAGMPCVIVGGRSGGRPTAGGYLALASLERLRCVIEEC